MAVAETIYGHSGDIIEFPMVAALLRMGNVIVVDGGTCDYSLDIYPFPMVLTSLRM